METLKPNKPRVLLVANTAWYLYNFRRTLARSIAAQGFEPVFVAPSGEYSQLLEKEGFRFQSFKLDRSGVNAFQEFSTLFALYQIYRKEMPVLVHHFTIKCILLGTLAAFFARVPATVNAITGIGHFLLGDNLRARMIRKPVTLIYRFLMKLPGVKLIFQNPDDLQVFKSLQIATDQQSYLIRSSGVDLKHFSPVSNEANESPVILFGGRLLAEKGIREFFAASAYLNASGVRAKFRVAGGRDSGNPSSISDIELAEWKTHPFITFLGHQENMVQALAEADIVVLPSYREGVPKILLEAAAMQKAIVATDVPGCREIVEDGVNGTLVPAKNSIALAKAIEELILNVELRNKMGQAGRNKVMMEFDDGVIADQTIAIYRSFDRPSNQL